MDHFERIVAACYEKGFTDLHISGGHPLVCRKDGSLHFQKDTIFAPEYIDRLASQLLNPRQRELLRREWSVDLALTLGGKRVRINVFSSFRGLSLAVRFLPGRVPSIADLNLHPIVGEFARLRSGLILLCGPTGSGKTTTIAAMVNEINMARAAHVITLEDPIEYVFNSGKAFIEQRELGRHFHHYREGLLDALREAPDVIVVGEMRRAEAIRLTLDAAESGHLVISTMHAGSPQEALYRICNSFPDVSQDYVRYQLSSCLAGVMVQRLELIPRLGFSVPHLTVMRNTKATMTVIRENRLEQLASIIETSAEQGMFSAERYWQEHLAKAAGFTPPHKMLSARMEGQFPREHDSSMIDYTALPRESDEAAHPAGGTFASAASEALTISDDDADSYLALLQSRG